MAKPNLKDHSVTFSESAKSHSGNVLIDATDADGDKLSVARVDDGYVAGVVGGGKGGNTFVGEYGTLVIAQDGSYTYTLNPGVDPAPGETLFEDFKIKIRDGTGNYDQGYLRFSVEGDTGNRHPIAVDDGYTFNSDRITGNVLDNDSDPDGDTLHVGGVIDLTTDTNYHITGQNGVEIEGKYGTLTISDNGEFTYVVDLTDPDTIAADFTGTETFAYKPHDGQNSEGNNTDYALITFNFNAGDAVLV